MSKKIIVVGAIFFGIWYIQKSNAITSSSVIQPGILDMVQSTISNATSDPFVAVGDPNVRAFLSLIRTGEGTADSGGYNRIFGGGMFSDFSDHPRVFVPFGNTSSSAAGAYQILSRTWDEMATKYSLTDFSPLSQDIAAVGLIKRRGALGDVLNGRFGSAVEKCNKEWASLPGSPYGQPTMNMTRAADVLIASGAQTPNVFA